MQIQLKKINKSVFSKSCMRIKNLINLTKQMLTKKVCLATTLAEYAHLRAYTYKHTCLCM